MTLTGLITGGYGPNGTTSLIVTLGYSHGVVIEELFVSAGDWIPSVKSTSWIAFNRGESFIPSEKSQSFVADARLTGYLPANKNTSFIAEDRD